jgi:hypothetical protein
VHAEDRGRISLRNRRLGSPTFAEVIAVDALVEAFVGLFMLLVRLFTCIFVLAVRLLVCLIALIAIAIWPRADKSEPYWQAVRRRAKEVLPSFFA